MLQPVTIADQILEVVRANPGCTLMEIIQQLKGRHWSDVFQAVEHMSRSGHLRLSQRRLGLTTPLWVL